MKRFSIFAILLGFVGTSLFIARPALTDQPNENAVAKPGRLEQLHKERIESLQQVVDIVTKRFETDASTTFVDVCEAQNELIDAKLDATDKPDERVALLEEQLKMAQKVLDIIDKQRKVGFPHVTDSDFLRAKAHCLAIEIKLLKERDKAEAAK